MPELVFLMINPLSVSHIVSISLVDQHLSEYLTLYIFPFILILVLAIKYGRIVFSSNLLVVSY